MTRPEINNFKTIADLVVQKYERYLPTAFDESMTLVQKMNKIIEYLNRIGKLTNETVSKWNEVAEWVMNDGLNESVIGKIDELVVSGEFKDLLEVSLLKIVDELLVEFDTTVQEIENARQGEISLGDNLTGIKNDLAKRFTNELHLSDFPRLGNEIDDSERLQRAIDSFIGNFAGTIIIPNKIYISKQINVNKTGLVLKGVGNKISKIISNFAGISIMVKPLFNGNPYTNTGYCKFYMYDVALQAEGEATITGTGLWLQWIYASSFINLFTSGFAKHIVLKGSHLNTFFNLYQENAGTDDRGIEIHNKGIGVSSDYTDDEAGESLSNNNQIIGGWVHNCHWNMKGLSRTITTGVDFEPVSDTMIIGDSNVFRDCRFERFDAYSLQNPPKYDRFTWFELGSNNKFENNLFAGYAGNNELGINPIFKVKGNNNYIDIDNDIVSFAGLIEYEESTYGNVLEINSAFSNVGVVNEKIGNVEVGDNTLIVNDKKLQKSVNIKSGGRLTAKGLFRNLVLDITLGNVGKWIRRGLTQSSIDITLPLNTKSKDYYTKLTLTDSLQDNIMVLNEGDSTLTLTKTGTYTLGVMVYIPSTNTIKSIVLCQTTSKPTRKVSTVNKWVFVQVRFHGVAGEVLRPYFSIPSGVNGDVFYLGDLCLNEGEVAFPTQSKLGEVLNPVFPIKEHETTTTVSNPVGAVVPKIGGYTEIYIQDNVNPLNFCLAQTIWKNVADDPIFNIIKNNVVSLDLVNKHGVMLVSGSTDYTVRIKTKEIF